MKWRVIPGRVGGNLSLPGDKSLAHRSLMFAALASGRSRIGNLPGGADVRSTAACLGALGTTIEANADCASVQSDGTLKQPNCDLDAGNSGTTMRLMSGILAGQPFRSRLVGDDSLSRRPMLRVAKPLREMGAQIETVDGHAPLEIDGGALHGIDYQSPVASGQIKSAVLLAGLFASGETRVTEPEKSRDHTERMLQALGLSVRVDGLSVTIDGGARPRPIQIDLPGDPSSAAFFAAAAVMTGGELCVEHLLLNETRIGFLRVLERMGADVQINETGEETGEPVGTLMVSGSIDRPVLIEGATIPSLIDELPLVALLATQAPGVTTVRDAAELRVKETDRIEAVVGSLRALGVDIEAMPDGFVVRGSGPLRGSTVQSGGDHRLAMMLAVAGCIAEGETVIDGADAAAVSFPGFADVLRGLGASIHEI